jgi:hypothetical protein
MRPSFRFVAQAIVLLVSVGSRCPLAVAETIRAGALVLELPERWSIASSPKAAPSKTEVVVELVNRDGRTRAFVESRPDERASSPSDALAAWVKASLAPRVASYQAEAHANSTTRGRTVLRARFSAQVSGAEPAGHSVIATLVREGATILSVSVYVPEGREEARTRDIEALFMAMEVRAPEDPTLVPPDPERISKDMREIEDRALGVRLRVPTSLRARRVGGRNPFRRRLILRSRRRTLAAAVRVLRVKGDRDLEKDRFRFEASLRRRHRGVTETSRDVGRPRAEDGSPDVRAYDARKRDRAETPVRVLRVVVRARELGRAFVLVLTAHPNHYVHRGDALSEIVSSFRLLEPKKKGARRRAP